MRRVVTGLLLIPGLIVAAPPETPPEPHPQYVISRDELMKSRPANGFKLVFAEPGQEEVCDTALGALNEPGYDTRYFNTSDKFDNSLSELLIQTRLNAPRTLLGTHLFRTEEYQVDNNKTGKKEYWYRFIGQGQYIFGNGSGVKQGWMEKYHRPFSDFFDFIDKGLPPPDCFYNKTSCLTRWLIRVDRYYRWENSKFDIIKKNKNMVFDEPSYLLNELINVADRYYLFSIGLLVGNSEQVRIALLYFDHGFYNDREAICFYESKFLVGEL